VGTVPLLYMGDELAQPSNDARDDAVLIALDSRWVQRPRLDPARLQQRFDTTTIAGKAYAAIKALMAARNDASFDPCATVETLDCHNEALLAIRRGERFTAVFNFSDKPQPIDWTGLHIGNGWTTLLRTADDASIDAGILPAWAMVWRKKP
jgi:amylosucrase